MHDVALATEVRSSITLICALLRGESPTWKAPADDESIALFLRTARCHGVTPLLDPRLGESRSQGTWPEAIRRACHEDAIAQAMYELALRAELARVLAALAAAGIDPLILKGTALAYSHYPSPALRPRGDTDLLVPPAAAALSARVFHDLGYVGGDGATGEPVSHQATWIRTDRVGKDHHFDVHWRISNSAILVKALAYEELAARARAQPLLGLHARALAPVDALLFACMHRAGHAHVPYHSGDDVFVGGDRLIWLYDIHLLLVAMSAEELDELVRLAAAKRLKAICLDAVRRTRECFATPIPQAVLDGLQSGDIAEPSARYLSGGPGRQMLGDFLALDGWSTRLQWLKGLGFPPVDHMRRKYPDATIRWMPALYARRAFGGLGKLCIRGGSRRRP